MPPRPSIEGSRPFSDPSNNSDAPIPDDDAAADTMPISMSASMMLSALPTDAKTALEKVDVGEGIKVKIRFQPVGNAPQLRQKVFQISASNRFETVVNFLRRKLKLSHEEHVFCYINSVFAPGLDEGVGGLFKCFKQGKGGDEQLVVGYAMTPAFG
ncbi:MAG: Ubiquitin-like protein [Stictis urceolatum]|nr:Ubiquitin-like protein [Stictis urceolata]